MLAETIKNQVFKHAKQWESGLLDRLKLTNAGGLTLQELPVVQWISVNGLTRPGCITVDECGQVYFTNNNTSRIYRYDPVTTLLEAVVGFGATESGCLEEGHGCIMHLAPTTLWVLNGGLISIRGFSRDNFQLKYFLSDLGRPVDLTTDTAGNLYVLDAAAREIVKYDPHGGLVKRFGGSVLREPVGMTVSPENMLYIVDRKASGFLKFTTTGNYAGLAGEWEDVFQLSTVVMGRECLYGKDEKNQQVQVFGLDGSWQGVVAGLTGTITGLAIDRIGRLYVSGSRGIAIPKDGEPVVAEMGRYYSKALDSRIEACQWHRLALEKDSPVGTVLEVYYFASDDPWLKEKTDTLLANPEKSRHAKAEALDKLLPWLGPEKNPPDLLFKRTSGRYLWLKLTLRTFAAEVRPQVNQMRVYYPRLSYMSYLPAIYQEEPLSKDFLERFLAIFETVFSGLEDKICNIAKFFNPATTPPGFLNWLASWLNLALDEAWPEEKKRTLVQEAATLYKMKGTPSGISRLIELYIGKAPVITEHFKMGKPAVLGGKFQLAGNSIVVRTPVRGFRLGSDAILGQTTLWDKVQAPEDPFLPQAFHFTILLDMSPTEFKQIQPGLVRVVDDAKPAHTTYHFRLNRASGAKQGTSIEVDFRLNGYRPVRVGVDCILGFGVVALNASDAGGRIEQHASLGRDTRLI